MIRLVNLLPLGESHIHIVRLGSQIELVLQHGKLQTDARIVRTLILALHIDRTGQAEKHLVFIQAVRVALRGRHHSLRHISQTARIKQRRYVPVVTDSF